MALPQIPTSFRMLWLYTLHQLTYASLFSMWERIKPILRCVQSLCRSFISGWGPCAPESLLGSSCRGPQGGRRHRLMDVSRGKISLWGTPEGGSFCDELRISLTALSYPTFQYLNDATVLPTSLIRTKLLLKIEGVTAKLCPRNRVLISTFESVYARVVAIRFASQISISLKCAGFSAAS